MDKFKKQVSTEPASVKNKLLKELPFDQLFKWFADSYSEQVPNIKWPHDYAKGMLKRVSHISTMKYAILPNMLYGNTVVFKLYDVGLKKEVNYGMMFCENINDMPEQLKKNLYQSQLVGNIVLQHYSVSSSFISCDGEYRGRFNRYQDFIKAKTQFPDIWNEIDKFVVELTARRQWSIYSSYFHGKESDNNAELERVIKSDLIAHSMLALGWFHTIYTELLGLTESHMNTTYKEIFLDNAKTDLAFMKELVKRYGEENVENFRALTSHVIHPIFGTNIVRYVPLGYKMIPLNLREVQDPLRLNYKPWREYLISNRATDLIINQIAPGFPVILDWFLIKKSSKGLFDNKSQYERLKHSELAKSILSLLHEAQRSTYFATSDLGKTYKSSDHIKQWISTKFKRLSDKIREPIDYSIEEIIMSDVTLAYPSEFVGRTFADTVNLISVSKPYDTKVGRPFSAGGYDIFAKYMFEVCYGLLTLNKKLGVLHGDFHLNNATIGHLYSSEPNSKVVYMLDTDHTFMFENTGYFACIIDFSRALINPESYEQLVDASLPESFRPVKDYDTFESREAGNLLNWYLQLYPNKLKQKEELTVTFKTKFAAVFKLLTCVDLFMFTARLSALMQQQEAPVGKRQLELVEKINRLSEGYIATEMNQLVKDESYGDTIMAREYPIATIIKKCFAEYINGSAFKSVGTVTDCYSLDNELKKSLCKFDLFPDVLKYSRYYDKSGKPTDVPYINKTRKDTREAFEKRKLHSLEHLKFLAHKYSDL